MVESRPPGQRRATIGDFLFGRRLASIEEGEQKIGPLAGVPVLGLDALSSAAYGPEAALTFLLPLGALGLSYVVPISAILIFVLLIVYVSYRRTIAAYPGGGGSYTVAKDNLGQPAALLAGAALALDYILNVAVGISAGIGALVSAIPSLVLLFSRINRHYRSVARQVADDQPLALADARPPIAIVPIQGWSKLTSRALRFALELAPEVHALHILTQDSTISDLTAVWEEVAAGPARAAGMEPPQLVLRRSTYRQFFGPLVDYVEQLRDGHPNRDIVVIVPDLVVRRWYHALLHNNRGRILRGLLRLRGGPRVVVVNTPFYLED
ncbi:MAG TPA: hypothetical protein VNW92_05115 [Polyangiaceae bacterium]|nr:hypothetical protein [Polyangiaceae bacterium]